MQAYITDYVLQMCQNPNITTLWSRNHFMEVVVHEFRVWTMMLEMSYNLDVGNDIESTYELIFVVLSIQVLWDLLHRVILQYLEYGICTKNVRQYLGSNNAEHHKCVISKGGWNICYHGGFFECH